MKRLLIVVGAGLLFTTGSAYAQSNNAKRGAAAFAFPEKAFVLFVGAVDYYSGTSWAYPMTAVHYDQAVARPLTLGVEVAYTAARVSRFCLAVTGCPDQADPLWYFTLDLQLHPTVGRVRPYLGASAGALMNCEQGWCRSLGLEGGLRVPVTRVGGVQVEGRWRDDHRYAFESTRSKEVRLGVFIVP